MTRRLPSANCVNPAKPAHHALTANAPSGVTAPRATTVVTVAHAVIGPTVRTVHPGLTNPMTSHKRTTTT